MSALVVGEFRAARGDVGGQSIGGFLAEVGDEDVEAGIGQRLGAGQTDAARGRR